MSSGDVVKKILGKRGFISLFLVNHLPAILDTLFRRERESLQE